MRINLLKFEQLLSEQNRAASSLRGVLAPATLARIQRGQDVSARTVSKLAAALGVAPHLLQGGTGVIINRAKLTVAMASRQVLEKQQLEVAGVGPVDAIAISNNRTVSLGTAWRIADTLGVRLEEIL